MTHGTQPAAADSDGGRWKADRDRKAARQLDMRQRRGQRELAAQLRERYEREAVPLQDDVPVPRID